MGLRDKERTGFSVLRRGRQVCRHLRATEEGELEERGIVILHLASLGEALGPVQQRPANVLDWGQLAQKTWIPGPQGRLYCLGAGNAELGQYLPGLCIF